MIQPLGDRIVVKPAKAEEMTVSGIVLPDTAREKPQEGEVVAVGGGQLLESGKRGPMEIKPGDTVIYSKYSGTEVKVDGEEYLIMRESDVLAIR
ncbi:MAG: co-chaperone GroES [bacterium]|nr:co-chaperone GroES [bacterium]